MKLKHLSLLLSLTFFTTSIKPMIGRLASKVSRLTISSNTTRGSIAAANQYFSTNTNAQSGNNNNKKTNKKSRSQALLFGTGTIIGGTVLSQSNQNNQPSSETAGTNQSTDLNAQIKEVQQMHSHQNRQLHNNTIEDGCFTKSPGIENCYDKIIVHFGNKRKTLTADDRYYFITTAVNPENSTVAAATRYNIYVWNYQTGKLLTTIEKIDGAIDFMSFTHDGKSLITSLQNNELPTQLLEWNLEQKTSTVIQTIDSEAILKVYSKKNNTLYYYIPRNRKGDGQLYALSLNKSNPKPIEIYSEMGNPRSFHTCTLSDDENYLLIKEMAIEKHPEYKDRDLIGQIYSLLDLRNNTIQEVATLPLQEEFTLNGKCTLSEDNNLMAFYDEISQAEPCFQVYKRSTDNTWSFFKEVKISNKFTGYFNLVELYFENNALVIVNSSGDVTQKTIADLN